MSRYVENLLLSVFSIDVGLSEDAIARHMNDPQRRKGTPLGDALRKELVELYSRGDTDWIALLENEVYEVYPATSQEDAKNFVTQRIWNVLFPDERDNPPEPAIR